MHAIVEILPARYTTNENGHRQGSYVQVDLLYGRRPAVSMLSCCP